MVTEQRFTCQECGKQFTVNGKWYNQLFYDRFGNLKFYIHCFKNHGVKIVKPYGYYRVAKEIVIIIFLVLLTIILKILWVATLPFALVNEFTS